MTVKIQASRDRGKHCHGLLNKKQFINSTTITTCVSPLKKKLPYVFEVRRKVTPIKCSSLALQKWFSWWSPSADYTELSNFSLLFSSLSMTTFSLSPSWCNRFRLRLTATLSCACLPQVTAVSPTRRCRGGECGFCDLIDVLNKSSNMVCWLCCYDHTNASPKYLEIQMWKESRISGVWDELYKRVKPFYCDMNSMSYKFPTC